jgi:hypothetical protein
MHSPCMAIHDVLHSMACSSMLRVFVGTNKTWTADLVTADKAQHHRHLVEESGLHEPASGLSDNVVYPPNNTLPIPLYLTLGLLEQSA